MLNLWMFVETASLFDSTLASSKPCIHIFTFSLFFMMTIIIKQTLFSIIETCMIHILPLFDNENHYQANSFWHHQNLKPAWFTCKNVWNKLFTLIETLLCEIGEIFLLYVVRSSECDHWQNMLHVMNEFINGVGYELSCLGIGFGGV